MAKKRKNRHLNIARKREKRRQNQKFKRKQLAFQKQRALQTVKSDEELLQDKIADSKLLLAEPEFENITFDPDLLQQKTMEALESDLFASEGEEDEESTREEGKEGAEHISEVFRFEVLPHLITVEFSNTMSYALKACETRFKRMGYREKAEVALVANRFLNTPTQRRWRSIHSSLVFVHVPLREYWQIPSRYLIRLRVCCLTCSR